MGTGFHIVVPGNSLTDQAFASLEVELPVLLHRLDRELFSTYSPTSELSLVNQARSGIATPVSQQLLDVLSAAQEVHTQSAGNFDITVKALVDLWGFGSLEAVQDIPDADNIAKARSMTGMNKFTVNPDLGIVTKQAQVALDLSAIAKGYAIDQVATLLDAKGLNHYLVEIGGEVIQKGVKAPGLQWQVGIELPDAGGQTLFQAIAAGSDKTGIATSGNYRNFFIHEGQRYSHVIDPATGWPVNHNLVSVTVVADSAMQADAWATALLVEGLEEGMARANALQLAAYFITSQNNGFHTRYSEAFNQYLLTP